MFLNMIVMLNDGWLDKMVVGMLVICQFFESDCVKNKFKYIIKCNYDVVVDILIKCC